MTTVTIFADSHDPVKEKVFGLVVNAARSFLKLPDLIEVIVMKLQPNVYGGVDHRHMHKIAINSALTAEESAKILIHELIHVEQRYTGRLQVKRNMMYWDGRPKTVEHATTMTLAAYKSLPWEVDAYSRQNELAQKISAAIRQKKA